MILRLSNAELEAYSENGFFVRLQVFQGEEVAALKSAAECAVRIAKAMTESASAIHYVLDGRLFVDIDHFTVQFEHHDDAAEIRVIEPVHELSLIHI